MEVLRLVQGRRQALGAHPNVISWGEFYSRSPAPHRADCDQFPALTCQQLMCYDNLQAATHRGLGNLNTVPCVLYRSNTTI
jgi:hypothetical protein